MASKNERARWDQWYTEVSERLENQKQSLTRMVVILTEYGGALAQIAGDEDLDEAGCRTRAQEALTFAEAAAASIDATEELLQAEGPSDPHYQGAR